MPLSHKPLEAVTEGDLKLLIDGAVAEGRRIEFKRDLPGRRDDDKREFLADVTSFANAAGGDLIFGMDESGGVAASITPIAEADADAELRGAGASARSSGRQRRSRASGWSDGQRPCRRAVRESPAPSRSYRPPRRLAQRPPWCATRRSAIRPYRYALRPRTRRVCPSDDH